MERITVKAPAKINLSLDVVDKREDGYHLLRMVMQTVDLCDYVTVEKNISRNILVTCDVPDVPLGKKNIVYRCAQAFFEQAGIPNPGIGIDIKKNIPSEAGLAGGSADGAATLVALNEIFETHLSQNELCDIGVQCGADIPFCIKGGTMLAEGVGDLFTPLPNLPECYIVIAKPEGGVSTAEAYQRFDHMGATKVPETENLIAAIITNNIEAVGEELCNVLEDVVFLDEVPKIKKQMKEFSCIGSLMSGSGSAVYGIFDNRRKAQKAADTLQEEYGFVCLCAPYERGATILEDN
ncbi:MAG: ispE [Caproiciproducens sp.]|nr:ispE [Caproiciproducens sp.]